jgi:Dolichyl-phosphate-mannose-protein mannosyltransferase
MPYAAPRPRALMLLLVVAFLIRLAAVLALRDITAGPEPDFAADPREFNQLAVSLATGHGYAFDGRPTSYRAPGWPLALAAVYWLFGQNYLLANLLSCAVGAATCLLAYAIARELNLGRAALWAGWLCAIYVPHIYFSTLFSSETLFAAVFGLCVWLFLCYLRSGSYPLLALAGLTLGYASLTRPVALLVAPPLLLILLYRTWRSDRHDWPSLPVFLITVAVVIVPWTLRTSMVHGRFVAIASNGGSTFYGGNNDRVLHEPRLWGGWVSTLHLPGRDRVDAQPDEVAHDDMEWELGLAWCRAHWTSLPVLAFFKLARLCLPDVASANLTYDLLQLVAYTPFLLLYLFSLPTLLTRPELRTLPWFTLHLIVLANILTALFFWGSPRFRDANTPLLMAYAVVGAQAVMARFGRFGIRRSGDPSSSLSTPAQ